MQKIPSISLSYNIFINENLTLRNNEIAFLCQKLKRADHTEKTLTRDLQARYSKRKSTNRSTI